MLLTLTEVACSLPRGVWQHTDLHKGSQRFLTNWRMAVAGKPNGDVSYPASLASRAATDESTGGGGNDATEGEDDGEDSPVAVAPLAPARAAITAMADVRSRFGVASAVGVGT